jgi:hypothetical protein
MASTPGVSGNTRFSTSAAPITDSMRGAAGVSLAGAVRLGQRGGGTNQLKILRPNSNSIGWASANVYENFYGRVSRWSPKSMRLRL